MKNLNKEGKEPFSQKSNLKGHKKYFSELPTFPSLFEKKHQFLNKLRQKQAFRVAIANSQWKSRWVWYEESKFSNNINLRTILDDEIVIEFDTEDRKLALEGINGTALNLYNAEYNFEIWEHGGKSPHIHIRNLPIPPFEKDKLRAFKKFFIKKFVPKEYHSVTDFSLCGIHMIALEYSNHWKGCYGVKKLVGKFKSKNFEEVEQK